MISNIIISADINGDQSKMRAVKGLPQGEFSPNKTVIVPFTSKKTDKASLVDQRLK